MSSYYYIKIKTYPENQPVLRIFYNVTCLEVTEKIENAPAFNINYFNYVTEDGKKIHLEIQGEIIEKAESE